MQYLKWQKSNLNLFQILKWSRCKWIDPKKFDLNKYTSNSSNGCVPEVDIEYPKELHELHNDYHLAPDKIEKKWCLNINQTLFIYTIFLLLMLKNST